MPGETLIAKGHTLFITQTAVFLGFLTIIGLVTALGRIFDAFTDPFLASLSDRCKHKLGRRIPFMRYAAIPFGVVTVLVFCSPIDGVSWVNNVVLAVCVLLFCLLHWPCSTTLLTIRKESGSWKWTGLAALLPTALGIAACMLVNAFACLI